MSEGGRIGGSFVQLGGGAHLAEPNPPAPDPDGCVRVVELGHGWELLATPEGHPALLTPDGSRMSVEYEPAPGHGWVERVRAWQERYTGLRIPLHLRPAHCRQVAANHVLAYWLSPQRYFRVVHACGCEERHTLPEGEDGRREVARLRRQPCERCWEW